MKQLILWLAILLPFIAQAQVNGTIQKTASTSTIRGNFGSGGLDTIPSITGTLTNGYVLKYNSTLKKWYAAAESGAVMSVTAGNGLTPNTSQTGAVAFRVDTASIQTVSNFFPKGDTRYEKLSNKATNLTSPDNTKYPTTAAVSTAIAASVPTNYWTTNTTQTGLTGDKTTSGSITAGGFIGNLTGNASTATTTAAVSGTSNYIPKFISATAIGNSQVYDNGTYVGIGTTSPANLLHLAGNSATPSLRLGSVTAGFYWDIGRENATTGDFLFNQTISGVTTERARITPTEFRTQGSLIAAIADNAIISADNVKRIGFTKKSGDIPKLTYGNGQPLIIAESNAANIDASNTFTNRVIFGNGGSITAQTVSGSGNVIVGADNTGLLGKIAIGSGLSLVGDTLSATGGSSGTVTTPGMTAGRLVVANSASDIGTTTALTISGSDLSVTGNVTATTFNGGTVTSPSFRSGIWDAYGDANNFYIQEVGVNNWVQVGKTTGQVSLLGTLSLADRIRFTTSQAITTPGEIGFNSASGMYTLGKPGSTYDLSFYNGSGSSVMHNPTGTSNIAVTGAISASNLSGTNTGDQTTITGNAGTATALQTARTISGTSFDGTANITLNNTGITNGAGYITGNQSITISGAVTGSGTTAITTTLANGIDATKLADGSVTSTEFQYINSLSSNAQTQLDAKAPLANAALTGNPTAPTQSAGDNSTKIATTAYVDRLGGGVITSGLYNGVITAGANVSGTSYASNTTHYTRVGNQVTVYGRASITATTASTGGNFYIDLPIAGNLTNGGDLDGVATSSGGYTNMIIYEDSTSDRAQVEFVSAPGTQSPVQVFYSFIYTVK